MTRPQHTPLGEARQLLHECAELRHAEAPANLRPNVLMAVGLHDHYATLDTAIGMLYVAFNGRGISAVQRASDDLNFERDFAARFGRPLHRVAQLPAALGEALQRHLQGEIDAGLRFDLRSETPFERAVLLKALEIPRGEVRPYSWIAREIGRPKAVRAVGTALGHNPIPVLIPCHRVVRSDYRIGDYIFGTQAKRAVLSAEGLEPDTLETLARTGVRYFGDVEDGTFCFLTCGSMYKRTDRQYLKLHSPGEAIAAGLQPCDTCRPSAAS